MSTPEEYAWRVFDDDGQVASQGTIAKHIKMAVDDAVKDRDELKKAVEDFTELHRTAVERGDEWKRSCERWIEMANAEGLVAHTLRKALIRVGAKTFQSNDPDSDCVAVNKAIALKPSKVEARVAMMVAVCKHAKYEGMSPWMSRLQSELADLEAAEKKLV